MHTHKNQKNNNYGKRRDKYELQKGKGNERTLIWPFEDDEVKSVVWREWHVWNQNSNSSKGICLVPDSDHRFRCFDDGGCLVLLLLLQWKLPTPPSLDCSSETVLQRKRKSERIRRKREGGRRRRRKKVEEESGKWVAWRREKDCVLLRGEADEGNLDSKLNSCSFVAEAHYSLCYICTLLSGSIIRCLLE